MSIAILTGPDRVAEARNNRTANTTALASVEIEFPEAPAIDGRWISARDGSTQTRNVDGRWWAGCSVPLLAGRSLLETLEPGTGLTVCLLHPEHAGIIRACREIVGPGTVIFVVHPDSAAIAHSLSAHDFSADIRSHRVSFFSGEDWAVRLRRHLDRFSGLATPARFVRTKLTPDPVVTELIADAQTVFRDVSVERSVRVASLRDTPNFSRPADHGGRNSAAVKVSEKKGTLVIGPSRFQLWRPSVDELSQLTVAAGSAPVRFDTDDALNGSPLALATTAAGCGSVFAADVFRSDAAGLVPDDTAWVTWVTRAVVPPFETAGPRDRIMLADPAWSATARKSGWPAERIGHHPYPSMPAPPPPARPRLGVLGHYVPPVQPESVKTFSSHRILWEAIETELLANPLAVGHDLAGYLTDRAGRMNLDPGELDQTAFFDRLIVQCYQRGLVTLLVRSGMPVALFGRGWIDDPALSDFTSGDLESTNDVESAAAGCTALVHILPIPGKHPIDALGRAVVRPKSTEPFLRTVKRALASAAA